MKRGGSMRGKMKILIGYDGSECADAALEDLQRAGLPEQCEALILSVAEAWLPPPPPSASEVVDMADEATSPAQLQHDYGQQSGAVKDAEELAMRAAARLKVIRPQWEVSAEASYGSPAWELVHKADQWKPALVVVGSHGRTALGRFVMGSISQRVLTEAACSVRVARGRSVEPSPVRIVVAVDGSAGSEAAVRAIAERNWPAQSEARVLVVDDPLHQTLMSELVPAVGQSVTESNREEQEYASKIVAAAAHRLNSQELTAKGIVGEGDPKRVIVQVAEEWGADCIFVGSTGFSNRLERFVLGSVSSAVAARAHCSVEIVREAKEES
jgi:nucleotide-binding universal stress UspA family protein